jgi:hypothetical protein
LPHFSIGFDAATRITFDELAPTQSQSVSQSVSQSEKKGTFCPISARVLKKPHFVRLNSFYNLLNFAATCPERAGIQSC